MFGGWDIFEENSYQAARTAGVLETSLLDQIKPDLEAIKPMTAVFDQRYVKRLDGPNVKKGKNKRDLAEQLRADIRAFKKDNNLDRLVMVWCGSTEVFMKESAAHQSVDAFEKALEANDPTIPSSMVYTYAALMEDVPFANGAPNLSVDVPAMMALAQQNAAADLRQGLQDRPDVDQDRDRAGHQGAAARRRGLVFDQHPGQSRRRGAGRSRSRSRRRKRARSRCSITSCSRISIPGLYEDLHHVVRINYYPPRGDNKEGWDNIDLVGWLGYKMQLKINFLCRDSILAAPIVLDLALFLDLAKRAGMSGHPGVAVVLLQESRCTLRACTPSTTCSSS